MGSGAVASICLYLGGKVNPDQKPLEFWRISIVLDDSKFV